MAQQTNIRLTADERRIAAELIEAHHLGNLTTLIRWLLVKERRALGERDGNGTGQPDRETLPALRG